MEHLTFSFSSSVRSLLHKNSHLTINLVNKPCELSISLLLLKCMQSLCIFETSRNVRLGHHPILLLYYYYLLGCGDNGIASLSSEYSSNVGRGSGRFSWFRWHISMTSYSHFDILIVPRTWFLFSLFANYPSSVLSFEKLS